MKKRIIKPMTEHTLLDALQDALADKGGSSEGRTVMELAEASGVHVTKVRMCLKKLIEDGKCVVGFQFRASIAGYMRQVPVYTMRK